MENMALWNGDCLELMKEISDNSVDMVFADLPYGTTACSWDIILPFDGLWENFNRVAKRDANFIFTASQPFTSLIVQSNIKNFKYEWIWQKEQATNPMLARKQIMKIHENVLVFNRSTGTYNPQMTTGIPYSGFSSETSKIGEVYGERKSVHMDNKGTRFPISVQIFSREHRRKKLHPTRKSDALMDYILKTFSNSGDTILDPTMGSGATGESCVRLNRNFIGIEKDKKYFNIAKERILG